MFSQFAAISHSSSSDEPPKALPESLFLSVRLSEHAIICHIAMEEKNVFTLLTGSSFVIASIQAEKGEMSWGRGMGGSIVSVLKVTKQIGTRLRGRRYTGGDNSRTNAPKYYMVGATRARAREATRTTGGSDAR
jgi:hypothetical protein